MNVQEEIRRLAYDFYEKSGKMCGMELEHWLRAEQIVMAKLAAQGKVQAAGLQPEKTRITASGPGERTGSEGTRSAAKVKVETAERDAEKMQKSASTADISVKPKKTPKKKPQTKTAGKTRKTRS